MSSQGESDSDLSGVMVQGESDSYLCVCDLIVWGVSEVKLFASAVV